LRFWPLRFWPLCFWPLCFWPLGFWPLGFWPLGFWPLGFWPPSFAAQASSWFGAGELARMRAFTYSGPAGRGARRLHHHPLEKNLDPPAGGLRPHHARRHHPRVIKNEQIPRSQISRQIPHHPIHQAPGGAIQHQQPARRPLG